MFTSFQGRALDSTTDTSTSPSPGNGSTNGTVSPETSNSQDSPAQIRPKRAQVARACDWCRTLRIKCDNGRPCQSCCARGERCESKRPAVRTLPSALKEVETLKAKLAEYEKLLEAQKASSPQRASSGAFVPATSVANSNDASIDPLLGGSKRRHWEGIQARAYHSAQTQFYGPSSSHYFIGRINSYLEAVLQEPHPEDHLMPKSASRAFASPTTTRRGDVEEHTPMTSPELTRTQEQYFIGLFWQSYHCTYQIFNESEFRDHYASLWINGSQRRQNSALVDIVVAICMQYGAGFIPRVPSGSGPNSEVNSSDGSIAGRWHYSRCQSLLLSEVENPSLATLQCQLLTVVYLCNATFNNMAYVTLGLAVRTAFVIGLQHEPSNQLPRHERELRKRLWWTLFTVENKTCIKLGRPWSVQLSDITCSLPSDDHALAANSGSNFIATDESSTWLTYSIQSTKLLLTVRSIYTAFFDRCSELLTINNGESFYNDPESIRLAADWIIERMKTLQSWPQTIPDGLRTKRRADGESYSTDRSPLAVDVLAPLWLQRQRLVLELLYHNLSMNLYRPFISFTSFPNSSAASAEGCAISCLNHAITITNIMYQVLTETDILNGWHEAFQWQWNATLSLIGFILANPLSPSCTSARKALDNAITIFEMMGSNFVIAANASYVTRDLKAKSELIMSRFCLGVAEPPMMDFSVGGGHNFADSSANNNMIELPDSVSRLDDASSAFMFNRFMDTGPPGFGFEGFMTPSSNQSMYRGFGDVSSPTT